jgi:hypothetical protein
LWVLRVLASLRRDVVKRIAPVDWRLAPIVDRGGAVEPLPARSGLLEWFSGMAISFTPSVPIRKYVLVCMYCTEYSVLVPTFHQAGCVCGRLHT